MSDHEELTDHSLNRRDFIGKGLAAAAALATAGVVSEAEGSAEPSATAQGITPGAPYNPRTHHAMPTRNLGKTGFQVGIFSLGGQATIEKSSRTDESVAIINRALDLGVNYIDSAAAYGKTDSWERARGTSERHIGMVMKTRRKEVFITSKTDYRSYDGSMQLLEQSLKNLQTDHLDLWQLHNVKRQEDLDQIFAGDGAIKALEKARDEGMVRFLGITGHFEPTILGLALERYNFDTILMALSAADPNYLSFKRYLLPLAQRKEIGIIGMKLAARGRLISDWTPPPLEEQRKGMQTPKSGTITMKESLFYNSTLPVSTNIVGVDNIEQLEQNVKWASEFTPLGDAEMAALEERTLPIVRQALYFRRWEMGA